MINQQLETKGETKNASRRRKEAPANASQLVLFLQKQFPNETFEELKARFREHTREDVSYHDELAADWFSIKAPRLLYPPKPGAARPSASPPSKAELAAKREAAIVKGKAFMLLDMVIDGKKLRDMTRDDYETLLTKRRREEKWLLPLFAAIKGKHTVGQRWSEREVRQLHDQTL